MNHALLKYAAVPEVMIPQIPPNKKFKPQEYDLDKNTWCGYDSDNKFRTFVDNVAGKEDYNDCKYIPE